jgi:hypothetical protein
MRRRRWLSCCVLVLYRQSSTALRHKPGGGVSMAAVGRARLRVCRAGPWRPARRAGIAVAINGAMADRCRLRRLRVGRAVRDPSPLDGLLAGSPASRTLHPVRRPTVDAELRCRPRGPAASPSRPASDTGAPQPSVGLAARAGCALALACVGGQLSVLRVRGMSVVVCVHTSVLATIERESDLPAINGHATRTRRRSSSSKPRLLDPPLLLAPSQKGPSRPVGGA